MLDADFGAACTTGARCDINSETEKKYYKYFLKEFSDCVFRGFMHILILGKESKTYSGVFIVGIHLVMYIFKCI